MITFAGGHQVLTFADSGVGLIVCPDPTRDRAYPGQTSMHAEEWRTVLSRLRVSGWELARGADDHDRRLVGTTDDGRPAYQLVSADAVTGGDARRAILELCAAAGVTPSS